MKNTLIFLVVLIFGGSCGSPKMIKSIEYKKQIDTVFCEVTKEVIRIDTIFVQTINYVNLGIQERFRFLDSLRHERKMYRDSLRYFRKINRDLQKHERIIYKDSIKYIYKIQKIEQRTERKKQRVYIYWVVIAFLLMILFIKK